MLEPGQLGKCVSADEFQQPMWLAGIKNPDRRDFVSLFAPEFSATSHLALASIENSERDSRAHGMLSVGSSVMLQSGWTCKWE